MSRYTKEAETDLVLDVPLTRATELSACHAEGCAAAAQIRAAIRKLTGVEPEAVRVYRTRLHIKMLGTWWRYEAGRTAVRAIRDFDDPETAAFPAGTYTWHPPRKKPEGGKNPNRTKPPKQPKQVVRDLRRLRSVA